MIARSSCSREVSVMNKMRIPLLTGFVALALTSGVRAADMPYGTYVAPGAQVQEFFSAWYLRLDGGYRMNGLSGGDVLGSGFSSSSLKDSGTVGGGVGYKWGWFRSDVTFDYGSGPKFVGDTAVPQHVTAKLSSFTGLLNGYIDMGSWWGFTPYIGAGVGTSYLKPAQFVLSNPLLVTSTIASDAKWDFSWAAMAGVSYALGPSFMIDASYRYLDLGEARSSVYLPAGAPGQVKYGNWTAQEVRIGLRYLIP
jgi:opacity protein-like surface antigen